jgi:hypothetical protein
LVSDYEKKYVMDMAMAKNSNYFKTFYEDLEKSRFKLIISEPLKARRKSQGNSFREENNAWVKWVAKPLLCYYEPKLTFKDLRIQLLVPRDNPGICH